MIFLAPQHMTTPWRNPPIQKEITVNRRSLACALVLAGLPLVAAAQVVIPMKLVDDKGTGASVGEVTVAESKYGLVFTPAMSGLPPGLHGFHLHENADCGPKEQDGKLIPAAAAGGHYDPRKTKRHGTPWGDGHLGDLPPLFVDAEGKATQPVLAPRLKMADIRGRALMVHAGGDNHADQPAALGGGGARVACGVAP